MPASQAYNPQSPNPYGAPATPGMPPVPTTPAYQPQADLAALGLGDPGFPGELAQQRGCRCRLCVLLGRARCSGVVAALRHRAAVSLCTSLLLAKHERACLVLITSSHASLGLLPQKKEKKRQKAVIGSAACAGSAPASAAYPTPAYMAAGPGAGVSEVAQPSSNPYDHYIGVQVCFHEIYGSHVLAALTRVRILCKRYLFAPFSAAGELGLCAACWVAHKGMDMQPD